MPMTGGKRPMAHTLWTLVSCRPLGMLWLWKCSRLHRVIATVICASSYLSAFGAQRPEGERTRTEPR